MDFDKLINDKGGYLTIVGITNLSSKELLETLEILENCTNCKGNNVKKTDLYVYYGFSKSIIENLLVELEKEQGEWEKINIICDLNRKLIEIDSELNQKKILCESC